MWLKRCCAMAAIVLLLFSVSLQPCYAEATDTGSPLYLYINPNSAAYDPITECTAYPVPWNKFEIGKTVNVVSEYIDYHFGVQSSLFRPLTTSGTQPTIYYAYGVVSSDGVPQPAYISTSGSIIGTAYNDRGGSLGSITQIRVSQMEGGSSHMRVAVCRTTLPHNTAMFSFPDSSGAPGFRVYRGTSGLGFAFAYVVNTDDSAVLSYLDQIVQLLTNMDADLDLNPYKLIFVFGKKGSGKSTLLEKLSHQYLKKGWTVYSTEVTGEFSFTTYDPAVINPISPKDIYHFNFPERSAIFIDEVSLIWDNRNFKNMDPKVVEWFRYQRHHKCRVYLFSQSFDIDKKLRDLCDEMYIVGKFARVLVRAKRIIRKPVVVHPSPEAPARIDEDLIVDGPLMAFFGGRIYAWIPYWAKTFNSFKKV